MCRTGLVASTHHINGINVGKLVEELTTAEGELGICLEELLSEETAKKTVSGAIRTLGWHTQDVKSKTTKRRSKAVKSCDFKVSVNYAGWRRSKVYLL